MGFPHRMLLVILGLVISGLAHGADTDVRVMSFNIRYGTAQDGDNHWDRRKEFLVKTVRAFDPDLLGTQETLGFQRDYLARELSDYDHLGVGRDDGRDRGEMMALYYKRQRFERVDGGHFWLSETPDVAGSKSWDSSLPRMVTWVKLRDRRAEHAPPLMFFNTHFDHLGTTARLESARLLRRMAVRLGQGCSVVVTGDFNTDEGSPPYAALFGPVDDQPSPIVDTFRAINPDRKPDEGTFSGFKAGSTGGKRIDWIGATRDWQIRSAGIDRTARDGRTPSDHFPVTAVLRRKGTDLSGVRVQSNDLNAVEPVGGPFSVESHWDLAYYDDPQAHPTKHKLNLFVPRGPAEFPVLFFIHGGAWTTGDRRMYGLIGKAFARHGVGTAVISYRLSPTVKHPGHIEDVARAFAWTHRHIAEFGGRPDRIFVSGQSAGGHLAALLCSDERYLAAHGLTLKHVRGAIPISGIYRFQPGQLDFVIGKGRDAAASASPLNHVSGDEPPFLILYAARDLPPCADMSRQLLLSLDACGVESECLEIADRNHVSIILQPMLDSGDATFQAMLKFIARHSELKLQPREPAQASK